MLAEIRQVNTANTQVHLQVMLAEISEHGKYTGTLSHAGRDKTGELSEYTGTSFSHAGDKTGKHSKYTSTPLSHAGRYKTGEHNTYTGTPPSQAGGNRHVSMACCL